MQTESRSSRHWWVLFHRWVGLVMAGFLLLAGLTGALLAWNDELDSWAASDLRRAQTAGPRLDAFTLRDKIVAAYPGAWVHQVDLKSPAPGETPSFYIEAPADPKTHEHAVLPNDQIYLDPVTGAVVGERKWGAISQGLKNLMPFVYQLHYQLALGTVGTYAFGIVALLWTLDCFVGAYLTLPLRARRHEGAQLPAATKSWWSRWKPAWGVRWRGGAYKINFDLHRAGALWVWAMLFVIAWSGVGFNLGQVYNPVMKTFFAVDEREDNLPRRDADQAQPGIPWHEAHRIAQKHMAAEAQRLQFTVLEEQNLAYDPHKVLYSYSVKSSADIRDKYGSTRLYFDANTGDLKFTYLPTGRYAGDTVTHWLTGLHMAQVWGLPFRIFVCAMGLVVAMLSVTGVVVWLKKRRGRLRLRSVSAVVAEHPDGPPRRAAAFDVSEA